MYVTETPLCPSVSLSLFLTVTHAPLAVVIKPVKYMVFSCMFPALLTAVNCYNVKWSARLQDIFTSMKMLALVIIIIAGLVVLCMGTTDNLADPFEGTEKDPGQIALAFYSGLFSYAGW